MPTRWIDQGASEAIIVSKTPNRHIAGVIEVFLKNYFSDKTAWQAMLKNTSTSTYDLPQEKMNANRLLPLELQQYFSDDDKIWKLNYPVLQFPEKVVGVTFDKEPVVSGVLSGIKGQYLLFADGRVLNIRRHSGYWLEVS
jgi:hypothetical protein